MPSISALHRWLGGALCLLLMMWFASGAVMVFARFPQWTLDEELAHAPGLSAKQLLPLPAITHAVEVDSARLVMFGERPVWRLARDGAERSVFADDGSSFAPLGAEDAAAEVSRRMGVAADPAHAQRVDEPDQWTVHPSARGQLPAWRFDLGRDGAQVYLALRTGAIVQHTTRSERVLAWVGPIPHWMYPTLLVRQRGLWNVVVLTLAALGWCACVFGLVAGALAWRVRGSRSPLGESPFSNGWLRTHHTLGLLFGVLACGWTFSGALSLSPLDWSPGPWPTPLERAQLAGGRLEPAAFGDPGTALAACAQRGDAPREIEAVQFGHEAFYLCSWSADDTRLVRANEAPPESAGAVPPTGARMLRELPLDSIVRAVQRGWPAQRIAAAERLEAPDAYHYPTPQEPRFAPYVRVRFADAGATALYVDPFRAQLIERHVGLTRLERWLYHGLHSLDLPWLYARPRLWRLVILSLLGAGFVLATSGVVMTVRWLRRAWRRRRALPPAAVARTGPT